VVDYHTALTALTLSFVHSACKKIPSVNMKRFSWFDIFSIAHTILSMERLAG